MSKFVFNNKLLSGVISLRVTSGVILTQLMFKNAIEKLFKFKKKKEKKEQREREKERDKALLKHP